MKCVRLTMLAAALVLGSGIETARADAVGTAFTFQGQLKDAGAAANGVYDIQYSLWRDATSNDPGEQVGPLLLACDRTIVDGLVTTQLDFGTGVFNGEACWLQINIRVSESPGCDPGEYTALLPRQSLTAAPYALYALNAPGGSGSWTASGDNIYNNNAGYVGIGTGSPSSTLHVRDTGSGDPSPAARIGLQWFRPMDLNDWFSIEVGGLGIGTGSSPRLVRESGTAMYFQTEDTMNSALRSTQMMLDADGKLGIGTTTPISMVEAVSATGVHGIRSTTTAIPMAAIRTSTSGTWPAIHGESASQSNGASAIRGFITSTSGSESAAVFGHNYGTEMNSYGVKGSHAGLGIGIYGLSVNGTGVYGQSTATVGGIGVTAKAVNGYALYAESTGTGMAARFVGNVDIVSSTTGQTLIEFGEGLDYAEGFDVSDEREIAPGTVLIIDATVAGKLAISNAPYDRKVAGIVAGANGLGSAVRLGAGEYDFDVALAGRVYCNVDASYGAIQPGDLLTTSPTPGHAMRVIDRDKAQGAILGKAMQPLEQGEKGQILVLVTLQ